MKENELKLLEEYFKKYYFDHFDLIHTPSKTSEREFGFKKFNSGMIRHLLLKNDKELHLLLMKNIPSDVYCSNGYYSFPNLPMNEKNWKEADLIFDIDAKDLNLECRKNHTISKCLNCDDISTQPNNCNNCSSTKLEKKSLPCKICIDTSKKEVTKLIEILTEDLGINQESIRTYFSGNEGFHVHVDNSQFQEIGSRERSELIDYIMFKGIIPETLGMKKNNPKKSALPNFDEKGWRERFAREVYGSRSNRSKMISIFFDKGYTSFQKTLEELSNSIGVKIDPNVTSDIHRIFRLPGSLNSKSGLTKLLCDDLKEFNPFNEASFLSEKETEVIASCPIQFKLKNMKFGPYFKEKISVPIYGAVYMICKNLATIS